MDQIWYPVSKLQLFAAKWRMLTQIQVPNQYSIPNGWAPLPIYGPGAPQGQAKPSVKHSRSMEPQCPFPWSQRKRVAAESLRQPRRTPGGRKCVLCDKMFICREHFKRHTKSVHTNERRTLSSFSALSGNEPDITFWQLRVRSLDV